MDLKVADAIKQDYGKFLEITHGRLLMLFSAKIPESFLPYPKETIEEALNVVAKHFHNEGNMEAVYTIQGVIPSLISYVSDKEAIKQAKKSWSNKKKVEAVLPRLGGLQKHQLEFILNKYKSGGESALDKEIDNLIKDTDYDLQDELFDDAVEIAKNNKEVAPSMLQRKLRVGYARAARLFDRLIEEGFVSEDKKT